MLYKNLNFKKFSFWILSITVGTLVLLISFDIFAQAITIPKINLGVESTSSKPTEVVGAIKILLLLTVLSLAPSILISMTSFTRIIIVFSLLRQAMGVQQMPPNQVVVGLSLFLSFYIMSPVFSDINENALKPYLDEKISQEEALDNTLKPLRTFMFKHTREKDLALFFNVAKSAKPQNAADVPIQLLVPAFLLSELMTAFQMGFMLFIPFLLLDMVVSSTLMAMGMMMLPPTVISLPVKIMLFVMVDGWNLVIGSIVKSFA